MPNTIPSLDFILFIFRCSSQKLKQNCHFLSIWLFSAHFFLSVVPTSYYITSRFLTKLEPASDVHTDSEPTDCCKCILGRSDCSGYTCCLRILELFCKKWYYVHWKKQSSGMGGNYSAGYSFISSRSICQDYAFIPSCVVMPRTFWRISSTNCTRSDSRHH